MTNNPTELATSNETRFAWRGVDASGMPRHGHCIAVDVAQVRHTLKRNGIFATDVRSRGLAPKPGASSAEITRFTRQLASLLRAGLPLAPALDLFAQSSSANKDAPPQQNAEARGIARIVAALSRDITAGVAFSIALSRHAGQFNTLYCQLVAVGEASGALPTVLERLADDRERGAAQRAKVRAALTYPAAILLLAFVVTAALLVFVVPTFKQIFDGFGAALPAPTQFVISLSTLAAQWSVPFAIACVAASVTCNAWLRRSPSARLAFDQFMLRTPLVGKLLTTLCAARWARALGTLLTAGTPLADAFDSLKHATGNAFFDRATIEIGERLRRGERLAAAMGAMHCFPADIVQPVAVAEESGALDAMLLDIASLADRQVDETVGTLAGLCEPLVIIVLGALIGGLVIAMYLPIIQLGNVV